MCALNQAYECLLSLFPFPLQGEEKEDKMGDTLSNQPTSKQDYTLVDIEDPELPLAASIEKQLHDLDPISPASCIYRVPPTLRQLNEKLYTPQIVSIGPFHNGKEELGQWEKYKLHYFKTFLGRTEKSVDDCTRLVKDWEERARNCYTESIDLSSNEFVYMMLVDSCFIIEVMWRTEYNCGEPTDYLNKPELIRVVQRDLILLENQIPFFVLHGLFDFCLSHFFFSTTSKDKFIKLSIEYFNILLLTATGGDYAQKIFENVKRHLGSGFEIQHFTDLLRICFLPTDLKKRNMGDLVSIPTAARLQEAGMKFETGTSKSLLDMKYNPTGLLEMPKFKVGDDTELLLKNLIALERWHYPFDSYIIEYVYFMDMFIDSARDVDVLIQNGIIVNYLSDSAAVASLFNNLTTDTTLFTSDYYFESISEDINEYLDVPWHKWKATFKRDYCSTPWMIAATAATILVVVLTLIQAICSIISLF